MSSSYLKDSFIDNVKNSLNKNQDGSNPGGCSGVSSWNDLTDKPFYDTRGSETITIDWDRTEDFTQGKFLVFGNDFYFKVSDKTPEIQDLIGGKVGFSKPTTMEILQDYVDWGDFRDLSANYGVRSYDFRGYFIVMLEPAPSYGCEAGIYFPSASTEEGLGYVTNLTYEANIGELKTIDLKYLPLAELKAALEGI